MPAAGGRGEGSQFWNDGRSREQSRDEATPPSLSVPFTTHNIWQDLQITMPRCSIARAIFKPLNCVFHTNNLQSERTEEYETQ